MFHLAIFWEFYFNPVATYKRIKIANVLFQMSLKSLVNSRIYNINRISVAKCLEFSRLARYLLNGTAEYTEFLKEVNNRCFSIATEISAATLLYTHVNIFCCKQNGFLFYTILKWSIIGKRSELSISILFSCIFLSKLSEYDVKSILKLVDMSYVVS